MTGIRVAGARVLPAVSGSAGAHSNDRRAGQGAWMASGAAVMSAPPPTAAWEAAAAASVADVRRVGSAVGGAAAVAAVEGGEDHAKAHPRCSAGHVVGRGAAMQSRRPRRRLARALG